MAVTAIYLWSDPRALATEDWNDSSHSVPWERLPCDRLFSVSEHRLDTQYNFLTSHQGQTVYGKKSHVFPRQVGGGSESRDPDMPAQGGGRRVVAGLCQRHHLGMEGSASLLLSGLCRVRASAPPRKTVTPESVVRACTHATKHSTRSVSPSLSPPSPSSLPSPHSPLSHHTLKPEDPKP